MSYAYTLSDGATAVYETAEEIISDAAAELGLGTVADPYSSTDANVVQLRTLLKRVGRTLALEREWRHLKSEHSFTTTSGVSSYALPADFSRMVDQTGWNRTTDRRLFPSGAQAWQYLKANGSNPVFTAIFRLRSATVELWPQPPTASETIAFEYMSRYWVQSSGASAGDKDAPTADTDVILFDPVLMVPALKVAWLVNKGMDASAALADFNQALGLVASANVGAAPVLRLSPGSGDDMPGPHIPDTGLGS